MKKLSIFIKKGYALNIIFFLWFLLINNLVIIKNYQENVKVNVFAKYEDVTPKISKGSLVFRKKVQLSKSGKVDTEKVGEYVINYTYKVGGIKYYLIKKVSVVDEEKPTIVFFGDIKACPNGKLLGDNFTATDNYDGDLTSKIVAKDNTLSISDSSGNTEMVTATIDYTDTNQPNLTLKGDSKIYLLVGNAYKEPGYEATDECDGDLSEQVKVSGSVNKDKTGTYTLTYEVSDTSGNKTSKKREVSVIKKNSVVYPTGKTIYLTFDDGPGAYTSKLLDILDKYNVKATFFVTNQFSGYQNMIGEEARRGHTVAVHTYSHNYKTIYSSLNGYFNDLDKMNNIIKNQTGKTSTIVRLPGGSSNTVSRSYAKGIMTSITNELTSRGYVYFDWNLSSGDAGSCTSSSCVKNTTIKYMNGNYLNILMHDIKSYTVNAVEDIIKEGLARGYTFQAINQNSPTFHQKIAN